jgi:hypothetical protein
MTTLTISANVTRVKVRQLDEFIYSHLIQRAEGETVRWDWDLTMYDEMLMPQGTVETDLLRSYIVDPTGKRFFLNRQF